jgi:leukotriene-A4 hydrolase
MHVHYRPPITNNFDRSWLEACEKLKAKWVENKGQGCSAADISEMGPPQVIGFLDILQDQSEPCRSVMADPAVLAKMDSLYKFSTSGNAERKFRWFILCITAEVAEIVPKAVEFLLSAGRMKFVRPLFRALFKSKVGRDTAIAVFQKNKQIYHPICSKMVAKDLGLDRVCLPAK